MNQVNVELGQVANHVIDLNATLVRQLAGVPSGTISMNNLHGKSWHGTGNLMTTPAQAGGNANPGSASSAALTFNTDGSITYAGNDTTSGPANWVTSMSGLWYMRVTPTAGSFSSSPGTGVWLAMDSNRQFKLGPATSGVGQCIFTIEFSGDGGSTISGTITGNKVSYAHGGA